MRVTVGLTLLGLIACAAAPTGSPKPIAPPNTELARGCWIERGSDGAVSMLRLLPSGGREELAGYLQTNAASSFGRSTRYALARDGAWLRIGEGNTAKVYRLDRVEPADQDGDTSGQTLYFLAEKSDRWTDWWVIETAGERLAIYLLSASGDTSAELGFHFRRDGCD